MSFAQSCYLLLAQVPEWRVTTYKAIANALGTKAYRAVGNAMNKNPNPSKEAPCHRVVAANGWIGGYAYGLEPKINLLKEEGINVKAGKIQNFSTVFFDAFDLTL